MIWIQSKGLHFLLSVFYSHCQLSKLNEFLFQGVVSMSILSVWSLQMIHLLSFVLHQFVLKFLSIFLLKSNKCLFSDCSNSEQSYFKYYSNWKWCLCRIQESHFIMKHWEAQLQLMEHLPQQFLFQLFLHLC